MRHLPTVFDNDSINLNSHQQCAKVTCSVPSHQHWLFSLILNIVFSGVKNYFILVYFEFPQCLVIMSIFHKHVDNLHDILFLRNVPLYQLTTFFLFLFVHFLLYFELLMYLAYQPHR